MAGWQADHGTAPGGSKRRLLVTGAEGQLGRALCRAPGASRWDIVAVGRRQLDIADRTAVRAAFAAIRPDMVVNAAAYTAVDRAESEAALAHAVNAEGPGHLAEGCAAAGAALLHVSTDYVFDGSAARPWRETDATAPLGVYGATKQAGEALIRQRLARHVVVRTAWLFGQTGDNFVRRMLRLGQTRSRLTIVADQRGAPTPAEALADGLLAMADRLAGEDGQGWGTYHFCGRPETSWFDWAARIFAVAREHGRPMPEVAPIGTADYPTPARRPAYSMLDCSKIMDIFGIEQPDWREPSDRLVGQVLGESGGHGGAPAGRD